MGNNTEVMILAVARKHFVRHGYSGTRMQQIADEAGINKAMLHYYYRSKDKLYKEVLSHTLDFMLPKLVTAIETPGSFWERTERIVNTYITTLSSNPDIPFFMMYEISQKQVDFIATLKSKAGYFPALQSYMMLMMEEMAAGTIREISPFQLILNIMSMTVFPFIAKPVFCVVADFPEDDFAVLMEERKAVVLDFLKNALRPG